MGGEGNTKGDGGEAPQHAGGEGRPRIRAYSRPRPHHVFFTIPAPSRSFSSACMTSVPFTPPGDKTCWTSAEGNKRRCVGGEGNTKGDGGEAPQHAGGEGRPRIRAYSRPRLHHVFFTGVSWSLAVCAPAQSASTSRLFHRRVLVFGSLCSGTICLNITSFSPACLGLWQFVLWHNLPQSIVSFCDLSRRGIAGQARGD